MQQLFHTKGPIKHCYGAKKVQHIFHFPPVEVENVQVQHNLFTSVRVVPLEGPLKVNFGSWDPRGKKWDLGISPHSPVSILCERTYLFTLRRESTMSAVRQFSWKEETFTMCIFRFGYSMHIIFLWCNMNGICDESVLLKSLAEHDNWTNLFSLSCSASDFSIRFHRKDPSKFCPLSNIVKCSLYAKLQT